MKLSEKNDTKIIEKGKKLSKEYHDKYGGCAQATFAAVTDSLDLKYDESTFKAMIGLSGGIARFGIGTCGAVAGAAAAISLSYDIDKGKLQGDKNSKEKIYSDILKFGNKFKEKYGGFTCRDVQMKLYGKSFNLLDEDIYDEFQKVSTVDKVIKDATVWAIKIILNKKLILK